FNDPKPYRKVALAYRKSTVKKKAIDHIVESIKKVDLKAFVA
ncbi:MAG TPA: LysR family transcriptional regulator, partial [Methylophilaceae bacterium]|nr:LysR family transcriptional regulator [Methylophilaceae bacterium]